MESNNVRMFHSLQQFHLIVDHLLIPLNILFQYDLDRELVSPALRLSYDAVSSSTKGPAESVL